MQSLDYIQKKIFRGVGENNPKRPDPMKADVVQAIENLAGKDVFPSGVRGIPNPKNAAKPSTDDDCYARQQDPLRF